MIKNRGGTSPPIILKNSRISVWESQKGNGFWTFLECPKLKRDKRLL